MSANTIKPVTARINLLVAGAVASVIVLGVIGVGAIIGVISGGTPAKQSQVSRTEAAHDPIREFVRPGTCPLCGTVESIRAVELRGEAGGAGAGAGLASTGVANPVGRERGVATIVGTVGDTAAGNEMENSAKKRFAYRVTVRMDDGSYRTVSQSSPPALAVGDKVRVVEGRLVRA